MAVDVLAANLTLHLPREVIIIQYVDDILLVSADPQRLHAETALLAEELRAAGQIIRSKSQMNPTLRYLG